MNTTYLRLHKARLTERIADGIKKKESLSIDKYQNVILTPLGQCYNDETRNDRNLIFEDTGFCTQISETQTSCQLPGITFYGGYIRSKWGHFITESIARLWALEEIQAFDRILFFTDSDNDTLSGNFDTIFRLLNISEKVKICHTPVSVESLLVPELGYEHDKYYTAPQSGVYHKIVDAALSINVDSAKFDKVFLSRSSVAGATKDGINLKAVENYFQDNGFVIVSPEMPLVDLIHILHGATEIATFSGTPAHNFAFISRPGSKHLYVIERHACVNVFQLSLNKMLGLSTESIDAFYMPRMTSSQDSIMLFAPTPQFKEWAKARNFSLGGEFVSSSLRTRRHELRSFLSRYRRYWCSGDGLCEWEIPCGDAIAEVVIASRERYAPWLHKALPVMWYDYLTMRALVRMLIYYIRKVKTRFNKHE